MYQLQDILDIPEETQTIEFKRLNEERIVAKVIETIVAMANTDGGVIVMGVDDPEKTKLEGIDRVFGIEEGVDRFDAIGREIDKIIPPLSHLWPPETITVSPGKTIAVLTVPKAVDSFRNFNNEVFIRQRKSNKRLTPQEIIDLSYAKGFLRADKELVDVDLSLLNTDYYAAWQTKRGITGPNIGAVLEKVGLVRPESGVLKPTRAAVLLFAEYPTHLMETKCTIRVLQYTGTIETIGETPNLIGSPRTIEGPIIKLIRDSHEYVLGLLRTGITVPSGFVTQYQIPERAVKETITNAVIHRDYHIKRDIEIKIFEDRIEIESPGLFPFNITPANIGYERSSGYRNDLVVKHLRDFASPPNLDQNEGVRAMRSEMNARNLYPPIFWTYPNLQDGVRVILLNEIRATEWEKVSGYLERNKYISNSIARDITGVVQAYEMSKILKRWVEQGLIIKIDAGGSKRKTKYRLPNRGNLS